VHGDDISVLGHKEAFLPYFWSTTPWPEKGQVWM